jgi:secreted trypsin-like serine protease
VIRFGARWRTGSLRPPSAFHQMRLIQTRSSHSRRRALLATLAAAALALPAGVAQAVVGGATATPGSWPWLAFIADTQNDTACTGTVISPMIVLTAGHCVEDITSGTLQGPSAFEVVTGRLDWSSASGGQVLAVQRAVVDPSYTLTTFGTDAALLVLATPTSAPPIALAGSSESSLYAPGTVASIAGWGLTSGSATTPPTQLQWGTTTLQSATYCTLGETTDLALFDPLVDVCALDTPSDTITACHGDSGGPLVVLDAGTPVEIGVTSRGDANCNPQEPTTFTSALALSSWIAGWVAQYPPPSSPSAHTATPPQHTKPQSAGGTDVTAYSGHTSQHGGRVSLTLSASGSKLERLQIVYALRCRRGPRGRFHQSFHQAIALSGDAAGQRSFKRRFRGAHRRRFTIAGTIASAGSASGTFDVRVPGGCSTGRVGWTAQGASVK